MIWHKYISFEHAFFVYWEIKIRLQHFNFMDLEGNVLAIYMDESLLAQRKFPRTFELVSLYKLSYNTFLTICYLGDNCFLVKNFFILIRLR